MRLTAELINNSLSYLNTLNERELDLRGHRIPAIENLGVAKDHEAIDFTDNDITTLTNFPLSPKLQTLLCARNRISSLQPSLAKSLPSLHTLVLTQNNLAELADLDPLQGFVKLTNNYRYYVLWRCPSIRFLDFQKVKDAERVQGKELFGTYEAPSQLAQSIVAVRTNKPASYSSAPMLNGTGKNAQMKLSEQEQARFKSLISKAKTLEEVQKLEKAYREGRLPMGVLDADAMDET
nr:u2 small nuclear ribonucleoprotein a' [Quercus suber]